MSRTATPADVLAGRARWCVVEGDALDVVRALPSACVDAVVTDPPAGIAFMGAAWDHHKGGRAQWVAWLSSILAHARTATRDGGRALVWSLPRTSHWTGCAVEDAGWSIESTIAHLFGTGWPKGSSQLKPAQETWWLARTGRSTALNVDACRVETPKNVPGSLNAGRYPPNLVLSHAPGCVLTGTRKVRVGDKWREYIAGRGGNTNAYGRATVRPARGHGDPDGTETVDAWECVEGCPVAELDAQSGYSVSSDRPRNNSARPMTPSKGAERAYVTHGFADRGGASRFFPQFPADPAVFGYHAKPSRAERNAGVGAPGPRRKRNELPPGDCFGNERREGNDHPTVKSVALMRWLIRLVTRPGDVVLDPFGGSGTTGVAALAEGRSVILIEREPRYAEFARQRCDHARLAAVDTDVASPLRAVGADFGPLFAGGTR